MLSYLQTNLMNYNISSADLYTRVVNDLGWPSPTIYRYALDANGNLATGSTPVTGYLYNITFNSYRNQKSGSVQVQPGIKLNDPNDWNVNIAIKQLVAPSAPIDGNLTVKFNGTSIQFPGNSNSLDSYFSQIPGLDRNFKTELRGSNIENHFYVVRLTGLNDTPLMTVQLNELTGGKSTPQVEITELLHSSNNLFFDPLPNEFLYTFSKFLLISFVNFNFLFIR